MSSFIMRSNYELVPTITVNKPGWTMVYSVGPLYIPPFSSITAMAQAEVTCDWVKTDVPIGISWYIGHGPSQKPMTKPVCQNIVREIHHMVLQSHSMRQFVNEKNEYYFYFFVCANSVVSQKDIVVEQDYGELIIRIDT